MVNDDAIQQNFFGWRIVIYFISRVRTKSSHQVAATQSNAVDSEYCY